MTKKQITASVTLNRTRCYACQSVIGAGKRAVLVGRTGGHSQLHHWFCRSCARQIGRMGGLLAPDEARNEALELLY